MAPVLTNNIAAGYSKSFETSANLRGIPLLAYCDLHVLLKFLRREMPVGPHVILRCVSNNAKKSLDANTEIQTRHLESSVNVMAFNCWSLK